MYTKGGSQWSFIHEYVTIHSNPAQLISLKIYPKAHRDETNNIKNPKSVT